VIGTAGRDISRADALNHVFGYTVINDVTARDLQKRHTQWFKGKSLDTFCPMGPVLVTADEIPNPQALNITMRVGGNVRQSSNTSKMIFPVDQCIEVLSLAFPIYARIAGGFNTYGAQFALFFLLATWFYFLSQLLLLGAVYNKFRLGEPAARGIVASPMGESRSKPKPVEAIEERKAQAEPPPSPRRSLFQRAAMGVVAALAVATGFVRRRRARSTI